MQPVIVYQHDNTFIKVDCDKEAALLIKERFSSMSPGAKFSQKFKDHLWDGKVSMFKLTNYLLPAGLKGILFDFLEENDVQYTDNTRPEINNISDEFLSQLYDAVVTNKDKTPRDYQHIAIKELLTNKKGVIEYGTGAGKSCIIYVIIRYLLAIGKRTAIIVPNVSLVRQMKNEFVEYGWSACDDFVTLMGDGLVPDESKPVLISTFQSLINQPDSMIASYGAVIVDEVHRAKSKSIKTILEKMPNADYRMGVTGTLPDEEGEDDCDGDMKLDYFTIVGYIGICLAEKSTSELMDEGFLTRVNIINLVLKYPEDICKKNAYRPYVEEVLTIMEYGDRNKIFDIVFNQAPDGHNSLILVNKLGHVDLIKNYLDSFIDKKYSIHVITGKVKGKKRDSIISTLESSGNNILVATYGTMSTGVNVRRLHNVFLASNAKKKYRVLQALGRGVRKHEDKEVMVLFDIVDDLRHVTKGGNIKLNYSYKQYLARRELYDKQGHQHREVYYDLATI